MVMAGRRGGTQRLLSGVAEPLAKMTTPITMLCVSLRPVLVAIPILAAVYCLWVWFRKGDRLPSWIGFFATTMGFLALVTIPAMLAAYLPSLMKAANEVAKK